MQYISWGLPPTVVILPFLHSLDFYLLLNFHKYSIYMQIIINKSTAFILQNSCQNWMSR